MIDSLQKLAVRLEPFRFVAIVIGALCFLVAAGIIFTAFSQENDRYLIPAITGLLWSLSAYVFISTFQSVPQRARPAPGFRHLFTRSVQRGWYGLLAAVFLGTTVVAVFLTLRLFRVWFVEYY